MLETWTLLKVTTAHRDYPPTTQVFWARRGQWSGQEVWFNISGGHATWPGAEELRTMEVRDYMDLPWFGTTLYEDLLDVREGSREGWLSPSGEFHPCRHYQHDRYAVIVLRQDVMELEAGGWARVREGGVASWGQGHDATEEQANWLLGNNGSRIR